MVELVSKIPSICPLPRGEVTCRYYYSCRRPRLQGSTALNLVGEDANKDGINSTTKLTGRTLSTARLGYTPAKV